MRLHTIAFLPALSLVAVFSAPSVAKAECGGTFAKNKKLEKLINKHFGRFPMPLSTALKKHSLKFDFEGAVKFYHNPKLYTSRKKGECRADRRHEAA